MLLKCHNKPIKAWIFFHFFPINADLFELFRSAHREHRLYTKVVDIIEKPGIGYVE